MMKKKLVIVDDSIFVYEEMKWLLADSSYVIAGYAKTGEEVLEKYESIQPDVITLDIILPGIDGLETAKRLLQKYPDAKIIMVSSLAYDDTKEQAMRLGIHDFIFKPIKKDALIASLDKLTSIK